MQRATLPIGGALIARVDAPSEIERLRSELLAARGQGLLARFELRGKRLRGPGLDVIEE